MSIRGQNIICLASQNYDDLWTRKQRWMNRLAADNRVLWVDLQVHALTWLRTPKQNRRRFFTGNLRQEAENLWVYTPPVTIPFFQMSGALCRAHNVVLNRLIRKQLANLGFEKNVLWLYTPYNAYQIGRLFDRRRIYECVDDFTAARGLIRATTVSHLEQETVRKTDAVIVTSDTLAAKFEGQTSRLMVSPNGADFDHFNRPGDDESEPLDGLENIRGPIIGFLGSVSYWVDVDLIAELAAARPDWTFVLFGPIRTSVSCLQKLPNVRLPGQRPYSQIPRYLARFDVCLNPYRNDGVAKSASPLKLYEYLASGKPIVSSDMPEAHRLSSVVQIAATKDEFIEAIEDALSNDDDSRRKKRLDVAKQQSWERRFEQLESQLTFLTTSTGKISDSITRPLIAVNTLSVTGPETGGGFTYVHNLLPGVIAAARDARFHLLVAKNNEKYFRFNDPRINITVVGNLSRPAGGRLVRDQVWINKWLRRIGADLYFQPCGWLPQQPPCPTVWTFQNLLLLKQYHDKRTRPAEIISSLRELIRHQVINRLLLRNAIRAERIIAVSEAARHDLCDQFPELAEKVKVVYEGCGRQFCLNSDGDTDAHIIRSYGIDQPYILSVSTLMEHKKYDKLIRAFARLKRETGTRELLVIAGQDWHGYRQVLQQIAQEENVEDQVRLIGLVQPDDLPAFYRRAQIFVLLSNCEAFGLPALEAMACGCPTIVADTGAPAEIVGSKGRQINPENVESLVDTLNELLHSSSRRQALVGVGIARAARFSWLEAGRQTAAVFQEILGQSITGRAVDHHVDPVDLLKQYNRVAERPGSARSVV